MIVVRLNTSEGVQNFNIPIRWEDITWETFLKIVDQKNPTMLSRCALVTGIDLVLLEKLDENAQVGLCNLVKFSYSYKDLDEYRKPKWLKFLNIGNQSWGKLEYARIAFKNIPEGKTEYQAAASIFQTYFNRDILNMPVTEVLGDVDFFISPSRSSCKSTRGSASTSQNQKSERPELISYQTTDFFQRCIRSLRVIYSSITSYLNNRQQTS